MTDSTDTAPPQDHDDPPVTAAPDEWEQVNFLLAPRYRVVEEVDGWRVFKRVDTRLAEAMRHEIDNPPDEDLQQGAS